MRKKIEIYSNLFIGFYPKNKICLKAKSYVHLTNKIVVTLLKKNEPIEIWGTVG